MVAPRNLGNVDAMGKARGWMAAARAALRIGPARDLQLEAVRQRLQALASRKGPITVGPWISEVGFELLYWIPFLHWAFKEYRIDRRRITIVSRGGVSPWYQGLQGNYVDILDHMTTDQFRELSEQRWKAAGLQKHMAVSEIDRAILDAVKVNPKAQLLHPESMYGLFDGYWSGTSGFSRFQQHTRFRRMAVPEHAVLQSLPNNYVAVKFYSRPSLPWHSQNVEFVRRFTLSLAEQTPVVFLQTDVRVDEHNDFVAPRHPNVVVLPLAQTEHSQNLLIQSVVVARASQVFCTYGGFSYLPLFYGVPAVGFFSQDKHFMKIHGRAAYLLANVMKTSLSVVDTMALGALTKESIAATPAAESARDRMSTAPCPTGQRASETQ